jgi:hypothetical protein
VEWEGEDVENMTWLVEEGCGGVGHCQVHRCPRKPPCIVPKFLQTTLGSHTTEVGRGKSEYERRGEAIICPIRGC